LVLPPHYGGNAATVHESIVTSTGTVNRPIGSVPNGPSHRNMWRWRCDPISEFVPHRIYRRAIPVFKLRILTIPFITKPILIAPRRRA